MFCGLCLFWNTLYIMFYINSIKNTPVRKRAHHKEEYIMFDINSKKKKNPVRKRTHHKDEVAIDSSSEKVSQKRDELFTSHSDGFLRYWLRHYN